MRAPLWAFCLSSKFILRLNEEVARALALASLCCWLCDLLGRMYPSGSWTWSCLTKTFWVLIFVFFEVAYLSGVASFSCCSASLLWSLMGCVLRRLLITVWYSGVFPPELMPTDTSPFSAIDYTSLAYSSLEVLYKFVLEPLRELAREFPLLGSLFFTEELMLIILAVELIIEISDGPLVTFSLDLNSKSVVPKISL